MFLQRHDPQQRDFRRVHNSDKQLALPITAVLKELERWETIPNRHEPFTLEMLTVLRGFAPPKQGRTPTASGRRATTGFYWVCTSASDEASGPSPVPTRRSAVTSSTTLATPPR
jgi:hypothetical protein